MYYSPLRYASISAALVSGLTLGITFSMSPFSSMTKVVLTTPAVEGKNYVVSFVSDNYADSSVTIPFGTVE